MEYAGFWRRSAAMAIDSLLMGIVQMVIMMVFMGGSIGTILISMYLPIFTIADAIN